MEGKGTRGGSPGAQGKRQTRATSESPSQEKASESRESHVTSIQQKIGNLREHLDEDHLDAVRREQKGEVVKENPSDNEPYDHEDEVKNAQRG
ncbi:polymorphic toxin type 28 domain-containing protein [Lichenicoccus sp.]|uniref:polymorphic toxin type 28 domain-containing protein n=1 Tax=Lichenicoccus sp. TaxID=2781899 RepID=UPI003D0FD136